MGSERYLRRFHAFMFAIERAAPALLHKLINDSISVSPAEVQSIFDMELVTSSSRRDPSARTLFYMRTFAVTKSQLVTVIHCMMEESRLHDELFVWLELVRTKSLSETVWIRYIGQSGQGTAFDRDAQDRASLSSGLLSDFTRHLLESFPALSLHVPLLEHFSRATYHLPVPRLYADHRERALIALFDPETLLNRQSGGFYSSLQVTSTTNKLSAMLELQTAANTRTLTKMLEFCRGTVE